MKQKKLITISFIIAALLIAEPTYARAFGWETTSQVSFVINGCTYIRTTETYYLFGIAIRTKTSDDLVGCDNTPSPCYPAPCPDDLKE